jgi:enoyl-CoA hydratase/carnithine racemase
MPETVLVDVVDQIATLTLNRPERRNAWTLQLANELSDALEQCDADDNVRVVVVTGAGSAFSVGADIGSGDLSHPGDGSTTPEDDRMPSVFPPMLRKPVIAAINGDAVGAGITFSLLCDIRVLAQNARVGFVFVRRGVIPEMGAHLTLPRVVGLATALDLILSGRLLTADEAAGLGLCTHVTPAADVLSTALRIARELAEKTAPVAAAISKRLLWRDALAELTELIDEETELLRWCSQQPDGAEGIASFVEKRPPRWTGRPSVDVPPLWSTTGPQG